MLVHEAWQETPGLQHGFLDAAACRGVVDWDAAVARAGMTARVVTVRQVHGARVVGTADTHAGGRPDADAVVTSERGVVAAVVTADCAPVLLVARRAGVAAAVHAGWRGAAAGVLEAAVEHLRARFGIEPAAVEACVGPAIGPCCYQVGAEIRSAFTSRTGNVTRPAWRPDGTRLRLDLRLAAQLLLEAAGVGAVATHGPCTACDVGFCSYRRDGAGAGRQLSFIGWA